MVSANSPFTAPDITLDPRRLRNLEGFAREKRLVHDVMVLDHRSIHRTDVVWINHESITDLTAKPRPTNWLA
jgi:hypothetical protein